MTDTTHPIPINGDVDAVPDFSKGTAPKRFRIDGDVFECAARLPVGVVREFIKIAGPLNTDDDEAVGDRIDALVKILDRVMFKASAERFAERLKSIEAPIDSQQLAQVMNWLMEQYGERPTKPATSSSDAQPMNGPTSTDGASPVASTSNESVTSTGP